MFAGGGDRNGKLVVLSSNLGGGVSETLVEAGAKIGSTPEPDLAGNLGNGPGILLEQFMGPLETDIANKIIGRQVREA
jgi:hypothetical protein